MFLFLVHIKNMHIGAKWTIMQVHRIEVEKIFMKINEDKSHF